MEFTCVDVHVDVHADVHADVHVDIHVNVHVYVRPGMHACMSLTVLSTGGLSLTTSSDMLQRAVLGSEVNWSHSSLGDSTWTVT